MKFQIRSLFDLTCTQIKLFQEFLADSDVNFCHYYQLPKIEADNNNVVFDKIDVSPLQGEQAKKLAINSFNDFIKSADENGKVLHRHPSIISLPSNLAQEASLLIDQINHSKAEFKKLVLTIPNKDARFEAVHSAIPNLVTLAFYRKIHYELSTPFSVRFTWMHKHSIKTLSKQDALDLLSNSAIYGAQNNINADQWLKMVELEKTRISSAKQKLRIRRPIKVSPQVNVRFSANNRYHVSAALPFIIFEPLSNIKLGTLPNYDSNKSDSRAKKSDYLIDRLYLEQI